MISSALIVPPLENGDKLTQLEFERRYSAMTHLKKAELIAGIVYMASPVRAKNHGKPHADIITWLGVYSSATPGTELLDNATVRLDVDNEPQPDALLRVGVGGQSTISQDDYVVGAPELIVEVAASSVSIDLHQKLQVYCRHQVQEYLIWRVGDRQFDWLRLNAGEYIPVEPNAEGVFCSQVFPGLWLDRVALLGENLAKVLEVLHQGLASQEHQDYVQQLD
jgi:Uma2 family endonuclease